MDFRQILEQLKSIEEARMGSKELSNSPKSNLTFGFEVEMNYEPTFDENEAREQAELEAENDEDLYFTDEDAWEELSSSKKDVLDMVDDYLVPLYGFAKVKDVTKALNKNYAYELEKLFDEAKAVTDNMEAKDIMLDYSNFFNDEYNIVMKDRNTLNYTELLDNFVNLVKEKYIYDPNKDYPDEEDKLWVYAFDGEDNNIIKYIPNINYNDLDDYFESTKYLIPYLQDYANDRSQDKRDEYIERRIEELKNAFEEDDMHISTAADIFQSEFYTDYSIDIFDEYHDYTKNINNYTVEPDSSIGIGIEVVSPVFNDYNEFLSELEKVLDFIENTNDFTTSNKTGLHINIGSKNISNLDLLKMLLFMGESYVAKEFGRLYNTYTEQTLDIVKRIIRDEKLSINDIKTINSKLTSAYEKYRTVNFGHINDDKGYLEFRVIGGKNYHYEWNKIKNTIGRFVRVIEIGMDPSSYYNDYIKKLSKLMQGIDPRALLRINNDFENDTFPIDLISRIRSYFSKFYSPRQMSGFGIGFYLNRYAFLERITQNQDAFEALNAPINRTTVRDLVTQIDKYSTDSENSVNYYRSLVEDNLNKLPRSPEQVKFIKSLL